MNDTIFYITANIFNIIFAIFLALMLFLFFIKFFDSGNDSYLILLLLLMSKILLPILYEITKRFFPNSFFTQFFEELKSDKQKKLHSILLAISYDIFMIIVLAAAGGVGEISYIYYPLFESSVVWGILTAGGVLAFYVCLFIHWQMQVKVE